VIISASEDSDDDSKRLGVRVVPTEWTTIHDEGERGVRKQTKQVYVIAGNSKMRTGENLMLICACAYIYILRRCFVRKRGVVIISSSLGIRAHLHGRLLVLCLALQLLLLLILRLLLILLILLLLLLLLELGFAIGRIWRLLVGVFS